MSVEVLQTVDVSSEEAKYLEDIYNSIDLNPYDNTEGFIKRCLVFSIPQTLVDATTKFQNDSEALMLLIRGLPVDHKLPGFPEFDRTIKNTFVSEGNEVLIGSLLGDVYSYKGERNGEIIRNIFPIESLKEEKSGAGSLVTLEFHCELAFHDIQPDYLSLMCLRGDENAITFIASVKEILSHMTPEEIEILRRPIFLSTTFPSYLLPWVNRPKPLIKGDDKTPKLVMSFRTNSVEEVGIEPLAKFRRLAAVVTKKFCLKKGEMIIFKNPQCAHARSPYQPKFDGNDRWIQQMYTHSDLSKVYDSEIIEKTRQQSGRAMIL